MSDSRIVLCTGGFDPLHGGHIAYLKAAKALGDILIVGLNSDEWLERKKGKAFMPWNERLNILNSLEVVDEVFTFMDDDDTAINFIKQVKAHYPITAYKLIFANGGDRTADNIPEMVFDDVEFVFGVGGEDKKNSSSWILKEWSAPKVERNWGHYRNLYKGKNFMVKELVINPQSSLSMQRHKHRSETWNLVSGNAELLVNWATTGDPFDGANIWKLSPQNPVDIPKNYWHKGRNNTDEPAHIVEIWKGDTEHLTEDDIERWYSGEDTE